MLNVEQLESLELMSTVTLVAGNLVITGDQQNNVVQVQVNPLDATQLQVNVDGALQVFATGDVQTIQVSGQNGDDILAVNAPAIATLLDGGSGSDSLWTFGSDTLLGGSGRDTLYSIVGASVIDGGNGADRLIGNTRSSFVTDAADRPIVSFGQAMTAPVQLIDGIVYFQGTAGNDAALIAESGNQLVVLYNGQSFTFDAQAVDQVVGIFGAGNDSVINVSHTDSVFYGAGGDDVLVGGFGDDILKGGNGSDILYAGPGGRDDLTGDAGSDVLTGNGRSLLRTDAADTVLARFGDVQISIAMGPTKR